MCHIYFIFSTYWGCKTLESAIFITPQTVFAKRLEWIGLRVFSAPKASKSSNPVGTKYFGIFYPREGRFRLYIFDLKKLNCRICNGRLIDASLIKGSYTPNDNLESLLCGDKPLLHQPYNSRASRFSSTTWIMNYYELCVFWDLQKYRVDKNGKLYLITARNCLKE